MLVSSIILFINSNFMFSNFSYFIANSFCFSISYEPLSKIGIGIVSFIFFIISEFNVVYSFLPKSPSRPFLLARKMGSVICAIGLIQFVGFCFAIRDEADMEIVFGDKRDVKNQPPILYYKKRDRKSGVTKREFYTTIPMERWKEKKDAICDRLDIHLIGDITYGGKKHNKGNHICFESAEGRITAEREIMYDDEF